MSTTAELGAAGVDQLFDADVRAVAAAAMDALAAAGHQVDPRVLEDEDGLRGILVTLRDNPPLRAVLRSRGGGPVADLVAADQVVAAAAVDVVLDRARTVRAESRRAAKQAKRGTAEQRRAGRLVAELDRVRAAREAAHRRAEMQAARADTLAAQVADLSEALTEAEERAESSAALVHAAQADLARPEFLAGHLRTAVVEDPSALRAALEATGTGPGELTEAVVWVTAVLGAMAAPRRPQAQVSDAAGAMAVTMLGGGVEVGGSCVLVEAAGTRVLVDVGVRPGARSSQEAAPPGLAAALAAGAVDAIVLTHAHNDHVGWVPAVTATHPVPVYATPATADLLEPMWLDSARLMKREGRDGYSQGEVHRALRGVVRVPFGRQVQIGAVSVELFPAGHVLGAAGVHLSDGQARVVVSGDVSGPGQLTVGGWQLPEDARYPDLLVLESTYGASGTVPVRESVAEAFCRDVELTVSGGGRVLVPAFALGRAQEVALLLAERLPWVEVVVDGLARDVSDVYGLHTGPAGSDLQVWTGKVQRAGRGRRSELVRGFGPGVVVTTSGMMAGGPVVEWAAAVMPDPASLVAVVGYQDPTSPGGRLLDLSGSGQSLELADGTRVEVNAQVRRYGLGAHASSDELVAIATGVCAKATMLVHGDPPARAALAERLAARHRPTVSATDRWVAASAPVSR